MRSVLFQTSSGSTTPTTSLPSKTPAPISPSHPTSPRNLSPSAQFPNSSPPARTSDFPAENVSRSPASPFPALPRRFAVQTDSPRCHPAPNTHAAQSNEPVVPKFQSSGEIVLLCNSSPYSTALP